MFKQSPIPPVRSMYQQAYSPEGLEHPQVECLVTGDKALLKLAFYSNKLILSPAEFVSNFLNEL